MIDRIVGFSGTALPAPLRSGVFAMACASVRYMLCPANTNRRFKIPNWTSQNQTGFFQFKEA